MTAHIEDIEELVCGWWRGAEEFEDNEWAQVSNWAYGAGQFAAATGDRDAWDLFTDVEALADHRMFLSIEEQTA